MINQVVIKANGQVMPVENARIKIVRKLNKYTSANVVCDMLVDEYDKFVKKANSDTIIEIFFSSDGTNSRCFAGYIKDVKTDTTGIDAGAFYVLSLDLLSLVSRLDIKKKKRSFQDAQMQYDRLIDIVLEDYPDAQCLNYAASENSLGIFTLQYRETDWEFLRRLASRFHAPIIDNPTFDKVRIYFGAPAGRDRGVLENYNFSVRKEILQYELFSRNQNIETIDNNFIYYKLYCEDQSKIFNIGDYVKYKGHTLYISKCESEIGDHRLNNVYELSTEEGLKQPAYFNECLTGTSIIGQVLDVAMNKLKIHLEIDACQGKDSARWFDYATFYSTWYAMPEINDFVNLHFPSNDESRAIIINSIKQDPAGGYTRNSAAADPTGDSTQITNPSAESPVLGEMAISDAKDPHTALTHQSPINFLPMANDNTVKMLATKTGQTLAMGSNSIAIDNMGNSHLLMQDGGGMLISTRYNISLQASGSINIIAAKDINISAKKKIKIATEKSSIELDPAKILIRGNDVIIN